MALDGLGVNSLNVGWGYDAGAASCRNVVR